MGDTTSLSRASLEEESKRGKSEEGERHIECKREGERKMKKERQKNLPNIQKTRRNHKYHKQGKAVNEEAGRECETGIEAGSQGVRKSEKRGDREQAGRQDE